MGLSSVSPPELGRAGDVYAQCDRFASYLGCRAARFPELGPMTQVGAGAGFSCALKQNGRVSCSGFNQDGRLGNFKHAKNLAGHRAVEVLVKKGGLFRRAEPLENVVKVAVSEATACAVTRDGEVYCWGGNSRHLIIGMPWKFLEYAKDNNGKKVPVWDTSGPDHAVRMRGFAGKVVDLRMGYGHACAILESGAVQCWGDNKSGQLADGNTASYSGPVFARALTE